MKDFLREAGVLFIGVGLGGLLVEQSPLFAAACVLGIALLVGAWILWSAENRFQQSEALDLVFDGADPLCAIRFDFVIPVPRYDLSSLGTPIHREPATTIRLRAKNVRSRLLSQVRVRVRDIKPVSGEQRPHYSDWLKWMHDDSPSHPLSVQGRQVAPGDDRDAYLDFVTKADAMDVFLIEFAMPHLRSEPVPAAPHFIHVVGTGVDDATGRSFPACHRAFLFDIDDAGHPTLSPKTLEECGFTG